MSPRNKQSEEMFAEFQPPFSVRMDGSVEGTLYETYMAEPKASFWDGDHLWLFLDFAPHDIACQFTVAGATKLMQVIRDELERKAAK